MIMIKHLKIMNRLINILILCFPMMMLLSNGTHAANLFGMDTTGILKADSIIESIRRSNFQSTEDKYVYYFIKSDFQSVNRVYVFNITRKKYSIFDIHKNDFIFKNRDIRRKFLNPILDVYNLRGNEVARVQRDDGSEGFLKVFDTMESCLYSYYFIGTIPKELNKITSILDSLMK